VIYTHTHTRTPPTRHVDKTAKILLPQLEITLNTCIWTLLNNSIRRYWPLVKFWIQRFAELAEYFSKCRFRYSKRDRVRKRLKIFDDHSFVCLPNHDFPMTNILVVPPRQHRKHRVRVICWLTLLRTRRDSSK